jgi:hypothetical protein
VGSGKLLGWFGELLIAYDGCSEAIMVRTARDDLLDGPYTDCMTEPFALHGDAPAVLLGDQVDAEITSSRGRFNGPSDLAKSLGDIVLKFLALHHVDGLLNLFPRSLPLSLLVLPFSLLHNPIAALGRLA